jgi:hypothetical protein
MLSHICFEFLQSGFKVLLVFGIVLSGVLSELEVHEDVKRVSDVLNKDVIAERGESSSFLLK